MPDIKLLAFLCFERNYVRRGQTPQAGSQASDSTLGPWVTLKNHSASAASPSAFVKLEQWCVQPIFVLGGYD